MKKGFYFLAMICLISSFLSCEKDEPVVPNEEELITTVNYVLTPVGGGDEVLLSFQDLDGDGEGAPVVTNGVLASNETYNGSLEFLNEAASPVEDITEEVEEEGLDHQVFFQSDNSNLSVTYNDEDADGNPLGLTTTVTTGDAGSGSITIILRHEPSKTAAGVSDGDISNAGGETDIEVTIPFDVE